MKAEYVISMAHPRTEKIKITVTAKSATNAKYKALTLGWPYTTRPEWVHIVSVKEVAK